MLIWTGGTWFWLESCCDDRNTFLDSAANATTLAWIRIQTFMQSKGLFLMNWLIDRTTEDTHEALTDNTDSLYQARERSRKQFALLLQAQYVGLFQPGVLSAPKPLQRHIFEVFFHLHFILNRCQKIKHGWNSCWRKTASSRLLFVLSVFQLKGKKKL